jgi:hypothetical protein
MSAVIDLCNDDSGSEEENQEGKEKKKIEQENAEKEERERQKFIETMDRWKKIEIDREREKKKEKEYSYSKEEERDDDEQKQERKRKKAQPRQLTEKISLELLLKHKRCLGYWTPILQGLRDLNLLTDKDLEILGKQRSATSQRIKRIIDDLLVIIHKMVLRNYTQ